MEYPKFYKVIYKDGTPDGFVTEAKMNMGAWRNENRDRIKKMESVKVDTDEYKRLTGFNPSQIKRIIDSLPKAAPKEVAISPKDLKNPLNKVDEQQMGHNGGNTSNSKPGPKAKLNTAV